MKRNKLQNGWTLRRFAFKPHRTYKEMEEAFAAGGSGRDKNYTLHQFPAQVHDVLCSYGEIQNPNIKGQNEELWIHEYDWAYRCEFYAEKDLDTSLDIRGMDTFADVYLNGVLVEAARDAFLYYDIPVTPWIQEKNVLLVYFHSAKRVTDCMELPQKYQRHVPNISAARVFRSGFHDYCGPIPSLIRCGIYGDVTVKQREYFAFENIKIDIRLEYNHTKGIVEVEATFQGDYENSFWEVRLLDAAGNQKAYKSSEIKREQEHMCLEIENPQLWYPANYGESSVYKLLIAGDGDIRERNIGFRTIEVTEDFDVTVNGKPVKLWGANLTHPDTMTNCYSSEKMNQLFDWAQMCNCNVLRVWGEGERYPQEFYEECDKRGLLVWQDFYLCCSMYPEEEDYMDLCRNEAEQLVKCLRHHPCILLWCGGNELFLARDYQMPDSYCFGEKIVKEVFKEVCERLDPDRRYHVSSPFGGIWANDPMIGDTHGYTHLWFVPGREFPVFLSENNRVSVPPMRTLKKMMTPKELWPKDYTGKVTRSSPLKWPKTWSGHNTNDGHLKLGPVERYFDPETPEELVYSINQSYAEYLRRQVGRFRRGYEGRDGNRQRKTRGHMIWKWNDNSNIISYGILDYFGEPNHAYYELKRCYQPFYLSCEFSDHGYIWVTNDTLQEYQGTVEIRLFDLEENRFIKEISKGFSIKPDESFPVCTLDAWGQFLKRHIICARAFTKEGGLLGTSLDCTEMERNMRYPEDTGLEIRQEGQDVVVKCKRYARCVELEGNHQGDVFGWIFEDNYFDLLPGEEKRIAVKGRHEAGRILAKAIYDSCPAVCDYCRKWDE